MKYSVIDSIGEILTDKVYITNPAIARDAEIKKLMIVLRIKDQKFYLKEEKIEVVKLIYILLIKNIRL